MDKPKNRHGCLTAYLIFMIVVNAITAIVTPLFTGAIQETIPGFPVWVSWVMAAGALLNIVFAVALLKWRKWGFFGFCAISAVAFMLNLYAGLGIGQSIFGLLGLAILYAVLQIGGEEKGWDQLE